MEQRILEYSTLYLGLYPENFDAGSLGADEDYERVRVSCIIHASKLFGKWPTL